MRKVITIILIVSLALLVGCGGSDPATILYVENNAYNLTAQEYIDLMNGSIEQQDADYPTIPNWDVESDSIEMGMWTDYSDIDEDDEDVIKACHVGSWFNELRIETNAEGKIAEITYHWEIKDQEQADAAYFMAGLTIGMTVGPDNSQEVYDALELTRTGVSSYINEYDHSGSHFYFTSYGYGKYNDLHISPAANDTEQTDTTPTTESGLEFSSEISDEDTRGIIGSHATDIRMGLTEFGLEEAPFSAAPDDAKEIFAHSCTASYTDEALGVTYDYSLTLDSNFQVIGAVFGITNQGAQLDTYIEIAKSYLEFCSTMPYDEANTEEAKSFVEDYLTTISENNSMEIFIGDARFELYGVTAGDYCGNYWLRISKYTK